MAGIAIVQPKGGYITYQPLSFIILKNASTRNFLGIFRVLRGIKNEIKKKTETKTLVKKEQTKQLEN